MDTVLEVLTVRRSGSLGQVVHSRNASGPYTRPRTIPFDPATLLQFERRRRLRRVSQFWSNTLTAAERRSWDDFANRILFTNRIGIPRALNGQQLFIRNNAGRPGVAFGIIRTAPTGASNGTYTLPRVADLLGFGTLTLAIDNTDEWANQDNAFLFVFVSDRRSPTINFFKGPFRFAGAVPGNSAVPPPILSSLTDPFGAAPVNRRTSRSRVAFADGRLTAATLKRFVPSP